MIAIPPPAQAQEPVRTQPRADRRTVPEPPPNPLVDLDRTIVAAEAHLREGELQQAESLYRSAIFDAWMMLGQLHMAGGKMPDPRRV